jgi:hypothetical protein
VDEAAEDTLDLTLDFFDTVARLDIRAVEIIQKRGRGQDQGWQRYLE